MLCILEVHELISLYTIHVIIFETSFSSFSLLTSLFYNCHSFQFTNAFYHSPLIIPKILSRIKNKEGTSTPYRIDIPSFKVKFNSYGLVDQSPADLINVRLFNFSRYDKFCNIFRLHYFIRVSIS